MQKDVIRLLGLISGGFFIAASVILSVLFTFVFAISAPSPGFQVMGFRNAMISVFAVGTIAGLAIMVMSSKLAMSDRRRNRVIAGAVIIIAAIFATPSTTGGFGAGIILALLTGIFAITYKEVQREEPSKREPYDEYWLK